MSKSTINAAIAILCGLLLFSSEAGAGRITGIDVSGPGLGDWFLWKIDYDRPDNDNDATDNPTSSAANFVQYDKTFDNIGYIDTVFSVLTSGGTSEYQIDESHMSNFSGVAWAGMEWELGFGSGEDFVLSDGADQLDFDTPDMDYPPYSDLFSLSQHSSDIILWYGGLVENNQDVKFIASIDVPGDVSEFTLRQTPKPIPEPTAVLLVGIGVIGLAGLGRKKLQKR